MSILAYLEPRMPAAEANHPESDRAEHPTENPATRYHRVLGRIAAACQASGRGIDQVRLLAVSKTQPASAIAALARLGQREFGENRLDEAQLKMDALQTHSLTWHFIGPIQSNKTRPIAERFDWVQSVDRPKIARRLAEQRPGHLPPLNVLIQVNADDEPQKAGCAPDQVEALAALIAGLAQLRLRGLMAIPAPRDDESGQLAVFERIHHWYQALKARGHDIDTLSIGMSGDLEAAVNSGSTMVRIGTALFGERLE